MLHPAPIQGRLFFVCRNFWSAHLHVFYLFAGYLNKILSKVLQLSWEVHGSPEVDVQDKRSDHVRTCKNAIEHL